MLAHQKLTFGIFNFNGKCRSTCLWVKVIFMLFNQLTNTSYVRVNGDLRSVTFSLLKFSHVNTNYLWIERQIDLCWLPLILFAIGCAWKWERQWFTLYFARAPPFDSLQERKIQMKRTLQNNVREGIRRGKGEVCTNQ